MELNGCDKLRIEEDGNLSAAQMQRRNEDSRGALSAWLYFLLITDFKISKYPNYIQISPKRI